MFVQNSGTPLDVLNEFVAGCSRKVAEEGVGPDGMNGVVQVGESQGPLKRIQPAAEIIQELMAETRALPCNAPALVVQT